MSSQLPITFRASALPSDWSGTPQAFLDAIMARIRAESEADTNVFITTGSVLPSSNVGLFLLNGETPYVWDAGTGAYIPIPLDSLSRKFILSAATPDATKYDIWVVLDITGTPIDIKSPDVMGAWKSMIASRLADYTNTVGMNAAIATASNRYPASAKLLSDQTLPVIGSYVKLLFNSAFINPSSSYDGPNSKYVAPVNGIYRVTCNCQVDNDTGTAAGMEFGIQIAINGGGLNLPTSGVAVGSPPGARWYPQVDGLVQASQNDSIEVFMFAQDGVNTGQVTVASQSQFFIELVQAL